MNGSLLFLSYLVSAAYLWQNKVIEAQETLNWYGHWIALEYSFLLNIEEIDTTLYVQMLEVSDNDSQLPGNIYQSVFTTLAWDNIDRLEETLSGRSISHGVNGIAVQPKVSGLMPQNVFVITKSKNRNISPPPLLLTSWTIHELDHPRLRTLEIRSKIQKGRTMFDF